MKFRKTAKLIILLSRYGRLLGAGALVLIVGSGFLVHYLLLPVTSKTTTVTKPIAFQTTTNETCNLKQGISQVATKGQDGTETLKYTTFYKGSKKTSVKILSDVTTTKPVTEVINKGIGDKAPLETSSNSKYPYISVNPTACQASHDLTCSLDNMTPNLGAATGKLSIHDYNNYVQQLKKDNCGSPLPYCSFTPSNPCQGTQSSSGYDAGYSYAEQNQICDPSYSNGNSQAFNDGVNAWTADNCTDGSPN